LSKGAGTLSRHNSKDAILDAVEELVAERGAAHLTLDAVAQRCEISKGGVMYNFPTKEALIHAMLARFTERHEVLRAEARQKLGAEPNELMVEVLAMLALPADGRQVHAGLLATIANEPSLLGNLQDQFQARYREITQGSADPEQRAIPFFAALGLHFHDVLNMALISSTQRERIGQMLLKMAAETPGQASTPADDQ
jgi:AcrR family transcriptional regulator